MNVDEQAGFTLIELMVVVLIIGILVSIAIPAVGVVSVTAIEKSCKNNLRTIDGASAQYQAQFGSWPTDVMSLVSSNYLKSLPKDPHSGATTYTVDAYGATHANGPLDHVTIPQ